MLHTSAPFPAHRATRRGHRIRQLVARAGTLGLLASTLTALMLVSGTTTASGAVQKAVSTTTNISAPSGNGACQHGPAGVDPTNCNKYAEKTDVWLSGLPDSASLLQGDYFFSVLVPGGQPDPNDGGTKNLSDTTAAPYTAGDLNSDGSAIPTGDAMANRTFHMDASGNLTTSGSHAVHDDKIQVAPFDDTTNNGGVYILAVCKIPAGGGDVAPHDCKYDAFKVDQQEPPGTADDLFVTKDADGAYDTTYTWTLDKQVLDDFVQTTAATATFNYSLLLGVDAGVVSNVVVTGTITVHNPNDGAVSGVDVTDQLSDGTSCVVEDALGNVADDETIPSGDAEFSYSCSLASLPQAQLDNTASITWPAQDVDPDGALAAGSDDFLFSDVSFTETEIDECITLTDTFDGLPASLPDSEVCASDAEMADGTTTISYTRTVPVPANVCVAHDNTAEFTTNDTSTTGDDSVTVTVCGPVNGGHTMGFWQNKNGQTIIKTGASVSGTCQATLYLRTYNPFVGAPATCNNLAAYVTNVIKAASASGATMNAMLKGQMLATALSVFYGDPANGAKIPNGPLGPKVVDLTNICANPMTCSTFQNVSSSFGGATSMSVSDMLAYASSQSGANGTPWYAQVKADQQKAKNAFDAINNNVAFATP